MLTAVGGILTEAAVWPSKIFLSAVLCEPICSVWFPLQGFSNKDVCADGMVEVTGPALSQLPHWSASLKDLLAFSNEQCRGPVEVEASKWGAK